jgi:hypothetical protein
MSVFTIKNRFLDPYDPFWICRILALKASTTALVMFIGHVFFETAGNPLFYMLTTLVATVASEILPANSKREKFNHFLGVVLLLSITATLFGLFSYFTLATFLFVIIFSYVVLRFMATNTQAAALPALLIVWGTIQFEGGAATDLIGIANNYRSYFQFSAMAAVVIVLFPDFTPNVAKSAFMRILESNAANIGNAKNCNSNPAVLSALFMFRAKLPSLPQPYQSLYESIIQFQNECMKNHHLDLETQKRVKTVLLALTQVISRGQPFPKKNVDFEALKSLNEPAYKAIAHLIEGYDQCLA